jgi:hypothetical protein
MEHCWLSQVLGPLEKGLRAAAELGAWQLVSPCDAAGRVLVVDGLHEIQDEVIRDPLPQIEIQDEVIRDPLPQIEIQDEVIRDPLPQIESKMGTLHFTKLSD